MYDPCPSTMMYAMEGVLVTENTDVVVPAESVDYKNVPLKRWARDYGGLVDTGKGIDLAGLTASGANGIQLPPTGAKDTWLWLRFATNLDQLQLETGTNYLYCSYFVDCYSQGRGDYRTQRFQGPCRITKSSTVGKYGHTYRLQGATYHTCATGCYSVYTQDNELVLYYNVVLLLAGVSASAHNLDGKDWDVNNHPSLTADRDIVDLSTPPIEDTFSKACTDTLYGPNTSIQKVADDRSKESRLRRFFHRRPHIAARIRRIIIGIAIVATVATVVVPPLGEMIDEGLIMWCGMVGVSATVMSTNCGQTPACSYEDQAVIRQQGEVCGGATIGLMVGGFGVNAFEALSVENTVGCPGAIICAKGQENRIPEWLESRCGKYSCSPETP